MDKRIFVEKKADFRVKSDSLVKELQHNPVSYTHLTLPTTERV